MVKKILKIFYQEFGGLHKAALILAASSILSAIFGLFRDRLLASHFGAGQPLDIYYASFKIPDFIYITSLSIVSVNVLIPFFLEKVSVSAESAKKFMDAILSFFAVVVFLIATIAFFLAPYLSSLLAPGFSEQARSEFIALTRILLLSPVFLGVSNLLSSVIQSYNRFFIYALSPIFYNVGIVFGIVFLMPSWGLRGVAAGVVLGALMHAFIQIPAIIKLGFMPYPTWKINFKEIWKVAALSFPRTIGLGLNQIILMFITAFASLLGAGSIAVFNLSFNLQSVPMSVIGMSYSVAAFPTMARLFVDNKRKEFLSYAVAAVRQIIFWSIPLSVLIIVLRAQIVRVVFGSGNFDWKDTRLTAAALAIFAVSIAAQSLSILFLRAFYASGKTWKPVMVNLFSAVLIIGISPVLMKFFLKFDYWESFFVSALRVKDLTGTDILALPTAFSVGMIANAVVLFVLFEKSFGKIWPEVKRTMCHVVLASVSMGAVSYFLLDILDDILNINTFVGIFTQGFLAAVFGLTVWFYVLRASKNKELEEFIGALANKFWKTPVVAPEPENLDK